MHKTACGVSDSEQHTKFRHYKSGRKEYSVYKASSWTSGTSYFEGVESLADIVNPLEYLKSHPLITGA